MKEVPLKDFEDFYTVSENGVIRSIKTGKEKKAFINSAGYLAVQLYKNNRPHSVKVHRAVARSFLRELEKGEVTAHLDGNKLNNSLSNLSITSVRINNQQSSIQGATPRNEDHWKCKLTDAAVSFIRKNPLGLSNVQLSELFGCSASHISNVKNGVTRREMSVCRAC